MPLSSDPASSIKIELTQGSIKFIIQTENPYFFNLATSLEPNKEYDTSIKLNLSNGSCINGKSPGLNSIKILAYDYIESSCEIEINILSLYTDASGNSIYERNKSFFKMLKDNDIKSLSIESSDLFTIPFDRIKTSKIIKQMADCFTKEESSPSHLSSSTSSTPSTPSTSSTPSNSSTPSTYNNYKKPRHRRSHGPFNAAKTEAFGGFVMGYVQKQWQQHADGESAKYGFWEDHRVVPGIRFGFCYNPQIKYGFGVNSGLNYEFYWSKTNDIEGYKGLMMEHVLSFPLHLEYRANFSKWFQLFVYGGFSFDCGVLGKMIIKDGSEEIYKNDKIYKSDDAPDWKRFNITADYGAGFRVNNLQVTAGLSRGLLDMSSSSDYTIKQNRPLHVDLTIMF